MAKNIMQDKRGQILSFLMPIIAVGIAILVLIMIVKAPPLCLFGNCWQIIPLRWGATIMFFTTLLGFILLNAVLVYVYFMVAKYGFTYGRQIVPMIKNMTFNAEKWIMHINS
jgi:hypothetical protein